MPGGPRLRPGWSGCRRRCVRVQAWSHPSRSTAATGPRPSPRSSGRTTSPSRCAPRSRTTGSTTPTSSPARAAAARPPPPGSWPARSTASRRRSPTRAASATAAATWPAAGPGSIDVIEIDAASHGGVDDARDLREKAFFAPVRSRYKVYIIDEAHMVTHAGLQRPAQAGRGAAAAPALHLRHHRARQGAPDDPVAHPPLPVPADPAAAAVVLPLRAVREGGRRRSSRPRCRWSCAPAPGRPATPCRCSTS